MAITVPFNSMLSTPFASMGSLGPHDSDDEGRTTKPRNPPVVDSDDEGRTIKPRKRRVRCGSPVNAFAVPFNSTLSSPYASMGSLGPHDSDDEGRTIKPRKRRARFGSPINTFAPPKATPPKQPDTGSDTEGRKGR